MTAPRTRPARRWPRRVAAAGLVYLALWGVTWLFGRAAAVDRVVAIWDHRTGRAGHRVPTAVHTGATFAGEGVQFSPDPRPDRVPWACVGEPSVPAPLVVTLDVAGVDGPLSGWAGRVTLLWTPWGSDVVSERRQWAA